MIKCCLFCENEFKTYTAKRKFCSVNCRAEYSKKQTATNREKICQVCNNQYYPKHSKAKYCSQKCMGIARNKTKECVCVVCESSFISKIIKGKQKTITCSRRCGYEYLKIKAGSYKKCQVCEKEFYSKGNREAFFCSRKCFCKSREEGKLVNCDFCGNETYKQQHFFKKNKNHFCNVECANSFQGRNKIKLQCKVCNNNYFLSKSTVNRTEYDKKYCSLKCRNQDKEWVRNACIKGNLVQLHKKGVNKLELKGREILQDIGITDFQEQVLMFDKFCVDVLIESKKIIIQWDGTYWHTKEKRRQLDESQDAYMRKCGYNVLRITDLQIKNNINEVYENIKRAI